MRLPLLVASGLTLLLTACFPDQPGEVISAWEGLGGEALAPCTASGSLFAQVLTDTHPLLASPSTYRTPFESWRDLLHGNVARVIDAHFEELLGENDEEGVSCTGEDTRALTPPTDALKQLAATLPPWKDGGALSELSESDLGAVLLEFVRVYECSLKEHQEFLYAEGEVEATQGYCCPDSIPGNPCESSTKESCVGEFFNTLNACHAYGCVGDGNLDIDATHRESTRREHLILEEFRVARELVLRALTLTGGMGNLRPIALEMACLERLSLDLRNILALAGEASACLPRIEDARGSLQDPPLPCGMAEAPTCDGDCPGGQACTDSGGGSCFCEST